MWDSGERSRNLIVSGEQIASFVQCEEGLCLKIGAGGGSDVLRTRMMMG